MFKKFSLFSFLLFLLFMSAIRIAHGQKWDKYLEKDDILYNKGDYSKAEKALQKFKKKITRKLGIQNEYLPEYYLRESRLNLALGALADFETSVKQALEISAVINGENDTNHALNQLFVAELYTQYGNFFKAQQFVDLAEQTLKLSETLTDNQRAQIDLTHARVLTGLGYYNESLSFINLHLYYFQSRAVTRESFVENGKLKTRRLSDNEVRKRLGDYAALLTLKANTYRKKGNYNSADSAFARAEGWISTNLGNTSLRYVQNQYLYGQLLVENGLDIDKMPNNIKFEKSLSTLKKDHEASHYLAFDLYETLLKQYLYYDNNGKYRKLRKEYEKAIKKNFKRTSLHYLNLETLEFDAKLDKERIRNLDTKVASTLVSRTSLPQFHEKRASLLDVLYRLAIQDENFPAAEHNLNEIIKIKEQLYGENSPEYHLSRIQLANYYLDNTDKFNEAEEIYEESFFNVVSKEIDPWHKDYVEILNHISLLYENTDQYVRASETLDQALNASREKYDDQDPDYAVELNRIAKLQIKLGEYDKAGENITAAVAILEKERKDEERVLDYINALETKAKFKSLQGLFDEAEDDFSKSRKLLSRVKSTINYNDLSATEELATLYITLGRYTATKKLLQELVASYEKRFGPQSRRLIGPLVNSGKLHLISGDYPEADKIARRAYDIAINTYGNQSSKLAPPLLLLSEINVSIGDYETALQKVEKAIEIEKKQFGGDHVDVGQSQARLALIKFYNGDDLKTVENLLIEARDIIVVKLGVNNPRNAEILTELAKVYIAQQKYDDAFNALSRAEKIWIAKVGRRNNINTAGIFTLTGDIYYFQRNYGLAKENYDKAKKLYEKFFSRNHPEYVKVLSKLSKVFYMEGDTKNSKKHIEEALTNYRGFIRKFFPALSEREKAKYWNTIKPDFEFYNTLAFGLKDDDNIVGEVYNNALLTKAILLNSSLKIRESIFNSTDEDLKGMYNEWLEKKESLTKVLSMSDEQLFENQIDPLALSQEVEQLEKELSKKSQLFSSSFEEKTITWQNVQQALKPNEVAIEMLRYRYFDNVFTDSVVYAAMYIKHPKEQKNPEVVLINNGRDLENKYFKYYRNSILYKVTDPYSYTNYWEPLKSIAGAYPTIYLSADGVYNQINLEVIPTQNGKYVIDDSNIILVSNTKDIYLRKVTTRNEQKDKRASMFANPDFYSANAHGSISDLPGTARELNELKVLLKEEGWTTSSYTQEEANEEQIKMLDNPKVFHIATHGFFSPITQLKGNDQIARGEMEANENPLLRTGLLLTGAGDLLNKTTYNYNLQNGILTAYEAMNLHLDQTELVVLSACETGLGELAIGEGVYGLQRAFLVAGARSLIMSMFKVDDAATQQLMTKFYRKWLETGNKRQAFIDAKKELRTAYQEPIYWGSFIMIGLE